MEERTSTTVQQNKRTKAWTDITNRELHQLSQKWQSPNSQKSVAKYIFFKFTLLLLKVSESQHEKNDDPHADFSILL